MQFTPNSSHFIFVCGIYDRNHVKHTWCVCRFYTYVNVHTWDAVSMLVFGCTETRPLSETANKAAQKPT